MKECVKVKKLLCRYLDNETNSAEIILVVTHLDRCLHCRSEFLELSRIKNFILGKERKTLPQGYLISHLQTEIKKQSTEERSLLTCIGSLARRLIPIPVAVITVALIFLVLNSRQQTSKYSLEENLLSGAPVTTETALRLILGV